MTQNIASPANARFRGDSSAISRLRRLVSSIFAGSSGDGYSRHGQADAFSALQRETDRIRLQSRHWLM